MSVICSFVKYVRYRQTQRSSGNVENTRLIWIASVRPICWPFSTLVWVSTHILGTAGLHQRTNRYVKLQRQIFLTCSAEPRW